MLKEINGTTTFPGLPQRSKITIPLGKKISSLQKRVSLKAEELVIARSGAVTKIQLVENFRGFDHCQHDCHITITGSWGIFLPESLKNKIKIGDFAQISYNPRGLIINGKRLL